MSTATDKRAHLALPAAALTLAAALIAPGTSAATPQNSCLGHISQGAATSNAQAGEHAVAFAVACGYSMTGFSLVSSNEIQGFDTDVTVYDTAQTLVPGEMFACEGDQPGYGINCNGTYGGGFHVIKGTFQTTDDPCADPREEVRLVVSFASVNSKGVVTNTLAGPFNLGRVHGCPRASGKHATAKRVSKVKIVRRALGTKTSAGSFAG